MEKLTGLARASVAVGLSEEFGFKSERMNFLAKGMNGLSKSGENQPNIEKQNLPQIRFSNIDHEIQFYRLLFQ